MVEGFFSIKNSILHNFFMHIVISMAYNFLMILGKRPLKKSIKNSLKPRLDF
jgi:hypothetical protein